MGVKQIQEFVGSRTGHTPGHKTVTNWINTGVRPGGNGVEPVRLNAVRVGKRFFATEADVAAFLAKLNPAE